VKIYPTGFTPRLSSLRPHTGDFEELRNFGMCVTRSVGLIEAMFRGDPKGSKRCFAEIEKCLRGVKPQSPEWRTLCPQHRRIGHGAKPQGRPFGEKANPETNRAGGELVVASVLQLLSSQAGKNDRKTGRAQRAARCGDVPRNQKRLLSADRAPRLPLAQPRGDAFARAHSRAL